MTRGTIRVLVVDDHQTSAEGLRDYLTLASVSASLRTGGYLAIGDSALRVYRQNTPDVTERSAVYRYTQDIWNPDTLLAAKAWKAAAGEYAGRLEPAGAADFEEPTNDLDNANNTKRLREIRYTVDGVQYTVGGAADLGIVGNQRAMESAYLERLDNLDTSYYTYSYYRVDESGDRALESVAIRRLNDAPVAGRSALDGGIYLT